MGALAPVRPYILTLETPRFHTGATRAPSLADPGAVPCRLLCRVPVPLRLVVQYSALLLLPLRLVCLLPSPASVVSRRRVRSLLAPLVLLLLFIVCPPKVPGFVVLIHVDPVYRVLW